MKTEFIKNAMRAFLEETVAHYNLSNRGTRGGVGGCQYSPTAYSCGCAIGRHVPNKLLCLQWDRGDGPSTTAKSVTDPHIFAEMPPNLAALGRDFLGRMQHLHDQEAFWNGKGLTSLGMIEVGCIREQFGLGL